MGSKLQRILPGFAGQITFGFRGCRPGRLAALFDDANWVFCNLLVEDELAFVLENSAVNRHEMRARVTATLEALDLAGFERRRISTLSGGERRRLALGAMMIGSPDVIVSDDLEASLDIGAIAIIRRLVSTHVRESGAAWLNLTRRLDDGDFPTGRYAVLADGKVSVHVADASEKDGPEAVLGPIMGLPTGSAVERALFGVGRHGGQAARTPSDVAKTLAQAGVLVRSSARPPEAGSVVVVEAREVRFGFMPGKLLLDGCDVTLRSGSIHVLAGKNGAGKTTLARTLLGLLRPQSGSLSLRGRQTAPHELRRAGALVFQNPEFQFIADGVLAEILLALSPLLGAERARDTAIGLLNSLELGDRLEDHPMTLSMGERRRLAVATALGRRPQFLVIDEPTLGQDLRQTRLLARQLRGAADDGMAILAITHDIDFIVDVADTIDCLQDGRLTALGGPGQAFSPGLCSLFSGQSRMLSIWSALAARGIAEGHPPRHPDDLYVNLVT